MSNQELQPVNNSEEIDLKEIFNLIGNFFKKIVRGIFQVIDFYKKKWVIVLGLLIVGIAGGYVLDFVLAETPDNYKQEFIVEPNYDSSSYFYNTVNGLITLIDNKSEPLPELNIDEEHWKLIKEITVAPVFNANDLFENMNNDAAKKILGDNLKGIDEEELEKPTYRDFYSKHKLTVIYKENNDCENTSQKIIEYIKNNSYYNELKQVTNKNLANRLTLNAKSIEYIDGYLEQISKEKQELDVNKKEFSLYSEGQEPNIAAIVVQKAKLLEEQQEIEKEFKIKNEVLKVVKESKVVLEKKKLLKTKIIQLPLLLMGLFTIIQLLKYILSQARKFAYN